MAILDYWHPVLDSRTLRPGRVAGVKVAGRSLAVFRLDGGQLGAVEDQCAHRRMKLSLGTVSCDKIVCPYHGWAYDADGHGESPSAARTHARIASYDCAEALGAIWIKARGDERTLSPAPPAGWLRAGVDVSHIAAPIELVIDNFSEVEHTVATHSDFGFDRSLAGQAAVEIESDDDAVVVRNSGPAKTPPLETRLVIGIRRGDRFHSDYTFRFDPPRSSVTHWWTNPADGRERMVKYHAWHYFVPQDASATTIVTFGFLQMRWPLARHLAAPAGRLFRRKLRQTIREDAFLVENLADQSTGLSGMTLSRFDRVLPMTRERLRRIYYGNSGGLRQAGS